MELKVPLHAGIDSYYVRADMAVTATSDQHILARRHCVARTKSRTPCWYSNCSLFFFFWFFFLVGGGGSHRLRRESRLSVPRRCSHGWSSRRGLTSWNAAEPPSGVSPTSHMQPGSKLARCKAQMRAPPARFVPRSPSCSFRTLWATGSLTTRGRCVPRMFGVDG